MERVRPLLGIALLGPRAHPATCLLLAVVLVVAGCAARRPTASAQPGEAEPAAATATTAASSCEVVGSEQPRPEPDGLDLALEVATAVVLVGVLATAIVLGARSGGITLPALQPGTLGAPCGEDVATTTCSGDCGRIVVADSPAPG
jgi:hypothetical protein